MKLTATPAAVLIATLAFGILFTPLSANAQPPVKVHRIGYLTPYTLGGLEAPLMDAFEQELRERGYVEGQNIALEYRSSEGRDELLPDLAGELVRLNVAVLLTVGSPATRAAKQATSMIPIVMVTVLDPVQAGFVASLAHPGGNITGSSELSEELSAKRLDLLKQAVPKASRIAVLWDPTHPTNAHDLKRTEAAARALGVTVHGVSAHDPKEIEKAFAEMRRWRADALVVLTSPALIRLPRIVALAIKSRLPTMYGARAGPEYGALMSYGPDFSDQWRHAAVYVDKILKGAKPGDLPVEQPTKFELIINLKTAKALGLTIPQSVLVRADEVIR